MGAESRKGRLYYYRKHRDGEQVISSYEGGGNVVELAIYRAELERQAQQQEKLRLEARKLEMADIDHLIDALGELIRDLTSGGLLAAGFHQHKGQWRKKRNGHNHQH
jgi:hypothetical protein